MPSIQTTIARELNLTAAQVAAVIDLVDQGNTIPFIARYRKEATGGIDDATLRDLDERLAYLRNLEARKDEVLRAIEEQGKLTADLRAKIDEATVMQRVEDLYKPYRKKRATRASKARDAGLEPLALLILAQGRSAKDPLALAAGLVNPEAGYPTPEDALQGAQDIVAEVIADDAEHVACLRAAAKRNGALSVEAVDASEKTAYEAYYDFSEPLSRIPNHRILAVNRGEKEKKLKVKVRTDADAAISQLERRILRGDGPFAAPLKAAIADGCKRLIAPSVERDLRAELTERAETDAIRVFAKNTESLLQQRPVRGARIIALDPGYRTGCKVAVLDEYGKLLDHTTVYPTPPRSQVKETQAQLAAYVEKHRINVIVIGNGTGSRETEEVVADYIARSKAPVRYTIVNEAGASVYSASKLASEEYPDLDVTTRGAMSLGRRLQDPLAELVKIPPQAIGVGQYQHDLNQAALERALTGVVENVVNRVGVDLNTASASLLGQEHRRLPRGTRRVHRPGSAEEGAEAGREGLPELRGLSAHLGRQEPVGRHERAPRKLRRRARAAQAREGEARSARRRRRPRHREPPRRRGRAGIRAGRWRTHAARHRLRAGKAGPRPPRRRAGGRVQRGRARLRRPDRGDGAYRHGAQRRRLRRIRGRRREAGRPRARLQDGRPLRQAPERGGGGGRHGHGVGDGHRQGSRQDLAVHGERQGVGARPHACR